MKRFEDYFDQIILERFLATAIKREHNIMDFLDKKILKYIKRDLNVKEFDEHGFHKYKKENIDLKDETYKELLKYTQVNDCKMRDLLQTIMDEVIWEYYMEDVEIPEFSFSFEEEVEKRNKAAELNLEVGKQYEFVEYSNPDEGLNQAGDYDYIEIAMISKRFPGKYIDKDKNIRLVEKKIFKELPDKEVQRRRNNKWILLEIVKTNEENVLLWMQAENARLYIKEKKKEEETV